MARTGRNEFDGLDGEADPQSLVDMSRPWKPVLWIGAATAVAFIVPLLLLPGTSSGRADARAKEISAALSAMRADLGPAQQALEVLTEPAAVPSEYPELLPTIADLRTHADAAAVEAAQGVPFAWPLASNAPFEDLQPHVRSARDYSATAAAVVRELVAVLNYRATYVDVLDVGQLPPSAPERFDRFISQLGDLSDAQQALHAQLPQHPALSDHRRAVRDGVRRFDSWIEEYVRALFIGDEPAVTGLLTEIEVLRRELDNQMITALAKIRSDLDAVILQLADDLDGTIAALE